MYGTHFNNRGIWPDASQIHAIDIMKFDCPINDLFYPAFYEQEQPK